MSLLKDKISALELHETELMAEAEKNATVIASLTADLAQVTLTAGTEAKALTEKASALEAQVADLVAKLATAETALATANEELSRKTAALANPAYADAVAGTMPVASGDAKEGVNVDRAELAKQLAEIKDPAKRQEFYLANFAGK